MSNVVYLKQEKWGHKVIAYDYKNLSRIEVYRSEYCEFETFDDKEEIDFIFSLEEDFVIIDKSEFDEALNNFKNNLNLISDKL